MAPMSCTRLLRGDRTMTLAEHRTRPASRRVSAQTGSAIVRFWSSAIAGAAVAVPAALAAGPLSYEDARSALHTVSNLQAASEAALRRSEREADAANTLRLPEVSLNYTRIYGTKTGALETPIGAIGIDLDLDGPRPSINSTWSLYTGGKISATQRALAAHVDQARAELAGTGQHLD